MNVICPTLPRKVDNGDAIQAQRAEAHELGYRLIVREAINATPPSTHLAEAYPLAQSGAAAGRPLAYGTSVVDAADAGLLVLRAIEDGQPWPDVF